MSVESLHHFDPATSFSRTVVSSSQFSKLVLHLTELTRHSCVRAAAEKECHQCQCLHLRLVHAVLTQTPSAQ